MEDILNNKAQMQNDAPDERAVEKAPVSASPQERMPKKKGGGAIVATIFVLLALLIGAGGAWAYQQFLVIDPLNQELAKAVSDANNAMAEKERTEGDLMVAQKEVERLSCTGMWDSEEGCKPIEYAFITPNGGEEFCTGEENIIEIMAPSDLQAVRIFLDTLSSANDLGDFVLSDTGSSKHTIVWNGENRNGFAPKAGEYKMRFLIEGQEITSDAYFTLKECDSMIDPESDVDADGLTYEEEKAYGTDPEVADTDGDGFSDGDEVKNGYNPNGEGLLTVPTIGI